MDMSFLYSYKPVLYPLIPSDYDVQCSDSSEIVNTVASLVTLCCRKIVQDATMTGIARCTVPSDLCEPLLVAALQSDHDRAIEQLIAKWPRRVLSLSQYSPAMFSPQLNGFSTSLLQSSTLTPPYYSELEMCAHMRRGVKQTTCLAHTFIECLKRRSDTKLQCLDLTGYPSPEVIVNYLASHVLLVYNEARQKEIIKVYDEVTRELPAEQRRQYSLSSTIPDHQYIISVDALVQSEETHMELCRALRVSQMANAKLRIRLGKLDISCLGVPRIVVLLEQLEREYLVGVSLQYNAITSEGLHVLCPVLLSFNKLTAVDLAYNGIVLSPSPSGQSTIAVLSEALAALPLLRRLNLSGIRMRGCIDSVLDKVCRPLVALRLSGCCLSPSDFSWLSTSLVTSRLEELDIGANNLTASIVSVLCLLSHTTALAILEADEAELNGAAAVALVMSFARLTELRYVNIANNEIGAGALLDSLELLIKVDRLRAVRLTVPSDIVVPLADPEQPTAEYACQLRDARSDFAKRVGDLLSRLCMIHRRPNVRLIFRM